MIHTCGSIQVHRRIREEHEERVRWIETRRDEAKHGKAWHGTARQAKPGQTRPRHAALCRAPSTLPPGHADADTDSDAATAAVRPLSRACTHVRVRVHHKADFEGRTWTRPLLNTRCGLQFESRD